MEAIIGAIVGRGLGAEVEVLVCAGGAGYSLA